MLESPQPYCSIRKKPFPDNYNREVLSYVERTVLMKRKKKRKRKSAVRIKQMQETKQAHSILIYIDSILLLFFLHLKLAAGKVGEIPDLWPNCQNWTYLNSRLFCLLAQHKRFVLLLSFTGILRIREASS